MCEKINHWICSYRVILGGMMAHIEIQKQLTIQVKLYFRNVDTMQLIYHFLNEIFKVKVNIMSQ